MVRVPYIVISSHSHCAVSLVLKNVFSQGWPLFHQLLVDLFKFLAPFLRNAELTKPTQALYKVSIAAHDYASVYAAGV